MELLRRGGDAHVAAYLAKRNISSFGPKAPPPKTAAFWSIVDASRAPEDAELADVIDSIGNPDATTLAAIAVAADGSLSQWISDRKNSPMILTASKRSATSPSVTMAQKTDCGNLTESGRSYTPKTLGISRSA